MFLNQRYWTLKSIECLRKNTNEELYDLILIDNGSNEETRNSVIEMAGKDVKIECFKGGVGVSYAYNFCIQKYAKESEYFVLLHNDVLVTNKWLDKILAHAEKIKKDKKVIFSSIFPRTNYSTEETACFLDKEIRRKFVDIKHNNKKFISTEDIEKNISDLYPNGIDKYIDENVDSYKESYKVVEEICSFCTLYDTKVFFDNGCFDNDFINKGCESKMFNHNSMKNDIYPIMLSDVYVHHNGNTTTDGPGKDFEHDLNNSHKLFNKKMNEKIIVSERLYELNSEFHKGKEALFIRDGGIGDIIISMFAISGLKEKYKNTKVFYMTKKENMEFVSRFRCVDRVFPINFNTDFEYYQKEEITNIPKENNLGRFSDIIFNWLGYVEYFDKSKENRVDKFIKSMNIQGIKPHLPEYKIDEDDFKTIDFFVPDVGLDRVIVSINSSCLARSLPKDLYMGIILNESKCKQVVVIGDSEEIDFGENKNICNLSMKLDVEFLPALIKTCKTIYTPDNGVLHMAALMDSNFRAFFGSIDPEQRLKYYKRTGDYKIYYKKDLLCVPCDDLGCEDRECMTYSEEEITKITE